MARLRAARLNLGRPLGSPLLAALLVVGASIALTWPMARDFTSAVPSLVGAFDPPLQAFLLGWDFGALGRHATGVFDAPIFYPEPRTLTYMDHLLGEAALASPVFAITRSVPAAYNFLVLASFALTAWTTYLLARSLRVSRPGAFLSGVLFAFSPFRFANLDLLNQLQTEFLPLGLWLAIRYGRKRRLRDAAGLAGALVLQVYFGWYYACYLAVALALLAAYGVTRRAVLPPRRQAWPLALLGGAGLLAIAPVLWPYVEQRIAMPELRRSLGESMLYSADVLDFVRSHPRSYFTGWLHLPAGAQSYWPGFAAVPLACLGAWSLRRPGAPSAPGASPAPGAASAAGAPFVPGAPSARASGYFILLALASFVISLGPILQVGGIRTWIPLPYALLHLLVPGFSGMRAPARFAVLTALAFAVLGGVGFDALRRRLGERSRRIWRAVTSLLFAAAILPAWQPPVSLLRLPTAESLPPAYSWLAARRDGAPLLELPVPPTAARESEVDAVRQYFILFHGHPRLDGCSGFVSRAYAEFRLAMQGFPDPRSLDAIARKGARYVLIHFGDYPADRRAPLRDRIAAQRALVPRFSSGEDSIYEIGPAASARAGP